MSKVATFPGMPVLVPGFERGLKEPPEFSRFFASGESTTDCNLALYFSLNSVGSLQNGEWILPNGDKKPLYCFGRWGGCKKMIPTLGKRLKELRLNRHLRQEQVARLVGVNTNAISTYENDARQPSYDILIRLANLYRVSTDYLLGVSDSQCRSSIYGIGVPNVYTGRSAGLSCPIKS